MIKLIRYRIYTIGTSLKYHWPFFKEGKKVKRWHYLGFMLKTYWGQLTKTPLPTHKKFGVKNGGFAEIGQAMHDMWFSGRRRRFDKDDMRYLLEWMWHDACAYKAQISVLEQELKYLKAKAA